MTIIIGILCFFPAACFVLAIKGLLAANSGKLPNTDRKLSSIERLVLFAIGFALIAAVWAMINRIIEVYWELGGAL